MRGRLIVWRIGTLLLSIWAAGWMLTGCGKEPAPPPAAAPTAVATAVGTVAPATDAAQTVIVAMGDSLTEGAGLDPDEAYPAQLERRLRADGYPVRVINAGNSGETSSGALSRIDWVLTLKPDIVILETGGNDGLRGIDPQVTEQNLEALVQTLQAHGVTVVLAGMQIVQNMGSEYVDAFRAIYPRVAQKYDVSLIPFFLDGVGGNPALNQPDAIHPTAEGYAVVVETIYPYVTAALDQVH